MDVEAIFILMGFEALNVGVEQDFYVFESLL